MEREFSQEKTITIKELRELLKEWGTPPENLEDILASLPDVESFDIIAENKAPDGVQTIIIKSGKGIFTLSRLECKVIQDGKETEEIKVTLEGGKPSRRPPTIGIASKTRQAGGRRVPSRGPGKPTMWKK